MNYHNERDQMLCIIHFSCCLADPIRYACIVSLLSIIFHEPIPALASCSVLALMLYHFISYRRFKNQDGWKQLLSPADFKPIPKSDMRYPDAVLTESERLEFNLSMQLYPEARNAISGVELTHYVALNTELLIRQYYALNTEKRKLFGGATTQSGCAPTKVQFSQSED